MGRQFVVNSVASVALAVGLVACVREGAPEQEKPAAQAAAAVKEAAGATPVIPQAGEGRGARGHASCSTPQSRIAVAGDDAAAHCASQTISPRACGKSRGFAPQVGGGGLRRRRVVFALDREHRARGRRGLRPRHHAAGRQDQRARTGRPVLRRGDACGSWPPPTASQGDATIAAQRIEDAPAFRLARADARRRAPFPQRPTRSRRCSTRWRCTSSTRSTGT